jgi:hypothetical protein
MSAGNCYSTAAALSTLVIQKLAAPYCLLSAPQLVERQCVVGSSKAEGWRQRSSLAKAALSLTPVLQACGRADVTET